MSCAQWLSDWQWRYASGYRSAVSRNLALLLEQPPEACSPMAREVFRHFGRYLIEFFTMHHAIPEVSIEGQENFEALCRQKQGVILLTAHLGNWELGSVFLKGTGHPIAAVALEHTNSKMQKLFSRQRLRCGIQTIPPGAQAVGACLRWLRAGYWLGLLADRDFTGTGLRCSWGKAAIQISRGAALLSLRAQSPIAPVFLIRKAVGKFTLHVESLIHPPSDRMKTASIDSLIHEYSDVLYRYVRRFPDQWLVFDSAFTCS